MTEVNLHRKVTSVLHSGFGNLITMILLEGSAALPDIIFLPKTIATIQMIGLGA